MLGVFDKKIIYPGRGDQPNYPDGTRLVFHYTAELTEGPEAGTPMDDSRKPYPQGYGEPVEIVLGKQFKIEAWEASLKTMREGEVARFTLPTAAVIQYPYVSKQLRDIGKSKRPGQTQSDPSSGSGHPMCAGMMAQMGLGYPELDHLMAHPQPMLFVFELTRVELPGEYEASSWQLKNDEKLATLPSLKDAGNALVKQKRYAEAVEKYSEALSRLESLVLQEKPNDDRWLELEQQKLVFFLNIAQCKISLGEYYDCIQACDEVLERDSRNAKATFRKAKALAGIYEFDRAREGWQKLMTDQPEMAGMIRNELHQMEMVERQKTKEDKEQMKNMFAR